MEPHRPISTTNGQRVYATIRGAGIRWLRILVTPRAFFQDSINHGEQAEALLFVVIVVLFTTILGHAFDPLPFPVLGDSPIISFVVWIGILVILVTPLVLHLLAAIVTIFLVPLAPHRGGISQTVQVIAYAAAPCVFTALPNPGITILATGYATVLLIYGTAVTHQIGYIRSVIVSVIPATIAFGYGFGGLTALETILRAYYII